jgi:hypothetical protein
MLTTKNRIETATNTRSSTSHLVLHNRIRDPRMGQEVPEKVLRNALPGGFDVHAEQHRNLRLSSG